jgi:hypothetical protein
MPHRYVCSAPCYRSFPTTRALVAHRLNQQECRERWDEFLRTLNPYDDGSDDEADAVSTGSPETPTDSDSESESDEEPVPVPRPMEPSSTELVIDTFAGAGDILAESTSPFMHWRNQQEVLGRSLYYPFAGRKEWFLAHWLHKTGMSLARIDAFLKLEYVRSLSQ